MGIAKDRIAQEGGMALDLTLAVESAACVVQVDVAVAVLICFPICNFQG